MKPLNVDWPLAQALYIKGIDNDVICNKLNIPPATFRKRVERGEWNKDREEAQKLLDAHPTGNKQYVESKSSYVTKVADIAVSLMNEQKKRFLEAGGDVAMRGIELTGKHLRENMSLRELSDVGAVAESFTKVAKPIFGLEAGTVVNVAVQSNVLSDLPVESLEWEQAPEA